MGLEQMWPQNFNADGDGAKQGGRSWQPFGRNNGHKVFVRRVFAIFATNASLLQVIVNLQYNSVNSIQYAIHTM